jgi:mono/diheme cytochrome c family protein
MAHDNPVQEEPRSPQLYGLVAKFSSAEALKDAARLVNQSGYTKFECYSPHAVHGIDTAMGTPFSPIPWYVLGGGLTGLGGAILMQWWMNAWDYPYMESGKPYWSLPANIPIAFELTVLISGITCFVAMIVLNKLFGYYSPLNKNKIMQHVTNDTYALVIEGDDPQFRLQATSDLLNQAAACRLEACYEEYETEHPPKIFWRIITLLTLVGLIPLAWVFRCSFVTSEAAPFRIDNGMAFQQKYKAQAENHFFENKETGRPPIEGTRLAIGDSEDELAPVSTPAPPGKTEPDFATGFPAKIMERLKDPAGGEAMMKRGQERFNIYCAQCHGMSGYGDGMIHRAASERMLNGDPNDKTVWTPPTSLHDPRILAAPEGQIYDTITHGRRKMMSYAARITPEDRWAIVLYVRALQKNQLGKPPPAGVAATPAATTPAAPTTPPTSK